MALTAKQQLERRSYLGASDVAPLMTGDKDKIYRLWQEKLGEAEPVDLTAVWPVALGSCTEKLNLEWYERKTNQIVWEVGWTRFHKEVKWAACTLDGWDETLHCPIECKHVGGREPLEVIIDRYQPQMQWQMYVTGAQQCALSVIMGANEPIVEYIDRDETYIKELCERATAFWLCVQTKTPPVALDPVPAPTNGRKVYDFTGNNEWCHHAADWIETRDAAAKNAEAAKVLKSMVPDDAKKVFSNSVQITRDRAGRLSLRKYTE